MGNRINFVGSFLHPVAEVSRYKLLLNSKPVPIDIPPSYKTLTEPVSFNNPKARVLPVTYMPFLKEG